MLGIAHVIPGLDPKGGGPSFTIPPLCRSLGERDLAVELHVCDGERTEVSGLNVHSYALNSHSTRLFLSTAMSRGLNSAATRCSVFHSHGLWMANSYYCDQVCKQHHAKHVISVHGALAPRAFEKSKFKKLVMWWALQRSILQRASCIHVTGEQEYCHVRQLGVKTPIAIIGLGTDCPAPNSNPKARLKGRDEKKRALYLGRIDPIKCLPNLIDAWKSLSLANWELHIVGSGAPEYVEQVRQHIRQSSATNILLRAPVYGDEKSREYYASDLFVLPSSTENFSLTVVEALSHRVPVIATLGTPWGILKHRGCGWWVNNSIESLRKTLSEAVLLSDDELNKMGNLGLQLVNEQYTWKSLSKKYASLYRWLISEESCPEFVKVD